MAFNQQLTEQEADTLITEIGIVLDGWLPYTVNYPEIKKGNFKELVKEYITGISTYTEQYHDAWSRCPKKQELIELIKATDYLDTDKSLKVFEEITGIKETEEEMIKIDGKKYSKSTIKEALKNYVK